MFIIFHLLVQIIEKVIGILIVTLTLNLRVQKKKKKKCFSTYLDAMYCLVTLFCNFKNTEKHFLKRIYFHVIIKIFALYTLINNWFM